MLRWVRGVCFSLWWRGSVGGSLYLYDVEGSTRSCWTGSLVSSCAILLRRVGFWVAACCGYCSPLGMTCQWARSPLEERVYRGAGRSRRRARGVLVWSGVASPVFVGARFCVSSFERERERRRRFSSVARSLRLCKKRRRLYSNTQTWWLLLLRDRPRLRPRSGRPQLAPRSQCVRAALCVV